MDSYDDDHRSEYLQDEYIENLIFELFGYGMDDLQEIVIDYENRIPCKEEDEKIAFRLFSGDMEKLDLMDYFNENLVGNNKDFNELTKFNQIYSYFKQSQNLHKLTYKLFVLKRYGFDYNKSDIKGETEQHQKMLSNLEKLYKNRKKE